DLEKSALKVEKLRLAREKAATKEAQRKAASAAKEALREARQNAKLEAQEQRARAKAEAQAARAKAEAAQRKAQQAAAREKEQLKKRSAKLQRELRECRSHAQKKLGTDLATITGALLDLLSQRPDVRITQDIRGPSLSIQERAAYVEDVPPETLLWYADAGAVSFDYELRGPNSPLLKGRLRIPPIDALAWTPKGRYLLAPLNEDTPEEWLSLEDFISKGATSLFTWDARSLSPFTHNSAPRFTPQSQVVETMIQKGLSERTANCLVRWLGESAR